MRSLAYYVMPTRDKRWDELRDVAGWSWIGLTVPQKCGTFTSEFEIGVEFSRA
jgi:hypothetical protein